MHTEEHDLLARVRLGPHGEQRAHHRRRERGVLLDELHHAVRQLRVVHGYRTTRHDIRAKMICDETTARFAYSESLISKLLYTVDIHN